MCEEANKLCPPSLRAYRGPVGGVYVQERVCLTSSGIRGVVPGTLSGVCFPGPQAGPVPACRCVFSSVLRIAPMMRIRREPVLVCLALRRPLWVLMLIFPIWGHRFRQRVPFLLGLCIAGGMSRRARSIVTTELRRVVPTLEIRAFVSPRVWKASRRDQSIVVMMIVRVLGVSYSRRTRRTTGA